MTVNIYGDEWDESMERDRPGWQWKRLPVGRLLGAEQIGASLYELAPGRRRTRTTGRCSKRSG